MYVTVVATTFFLLGNRCLPLKALSWNWLYIFFYLTKHIYVRQFSYNCMKFFVRISKFNLYNHWFIQYFYLKVDESFLDINLHCFVEVLEIPNILDNILLFLCAVSLIIVPSNMYVIIYNQLGKWSKNYLRRRNCGEDGLFLGIDYTRMNHHLTTRFMLQFQYLNLCWYEYILSFAYW